MEEYSSLPTIGLVPNLAGQVWLHWYWTVPPRPLVRGSGMGTETISVMEKNKDAKKITSEPCGENLSLLLIGRNIRARDYG